MVLKRGTSFAVKRVAILGSTGSIGVSTLDVIAREKDKFSVFALTTNQNVESLGLQIKRFSPKVVCVRDSHQADALGRVVSLQRTKVVVGKEGLCEIAGAEDVDLVVHGIAGSAGLLPLLSALQAGKRVALANKESIVMAGDVVFQMAKKYQAEIIPVDSEHSAIFQCLQGHTLNNISRIILTASGGPFRDLRREELAEISREQALRHPTWRMGKKVTIDSATLINKGLEVIEAHFLFEMPYEKISILIHPQSIVHSMVEFVDGALLLHASVPDMRLPISFALNYPDRSQRVAFKLNLSDVQNLTFFEPEFERFPGLRIAIEAGREGGVLPAVFNAANEVAVKEFLDEGIGFNDIPVVIEKTMALFKGEDGIKKPGLDEIFRSDRLARERATAIIREIKNEGIN
jgi:1-deoxy-D-xylulose-5-phosphate reductoisomerase